uniref:Uncharacterized protein n=1 Tax=Arundo donax TaxID=35708 RepID=A0A0A9G522_ARUDO
MFSWFSNRLVQHIRSPPTVAEEDACVLYMHRAFGNTSEGFQSVRKVKQI